METMRPFHIKTNNHNPRVECQYEQESFDDKVVLCELDEEDLYDDEDLASQDMKDPIISDKSSGDIWKIILVSLNTTVEILEDIHDVELMFEEEKYGNEL